MEPVNLMPVLELFHCSTEHKFKSTPLRAPLIITYVNFQAEQIIHLSKSAKE